ncbi:MAG TPA: O-antigen ligase family protein [Terracidiphilus sp.]|nr:O-antigen ligase family protein [Terracidiphilus sp.]
MRRVAQILLLFFAFAIPWEYSLDLGEPLGNVARILGIVVLLAAIPAVLQVGRIRRLGPMQWLAITLYLWLCCTYFWTIDPTATATKIRAYFQEMMIVWLVWEFADSPSDLRNLLRAYVAGSWVLAALTLADFRSAEVLAAGQMRFAAYGQDPNDVARFLDIGFSLAALLVTCESRWPARLLALGYLPLGLFALLLTASREGFLGALIVLAGCTALLLRGRSKWALAAIFALPFAGVMLWFTIPSEIFDRLATIPAQLQGGDLNQRLNIWSAGWYVFAQAPLVGNGVGTFVIATGLSPIDTAHNTVISLLVEGGLCAVFLAAGVVVLAAFSVFATRGSLRIALATALLVWGMTSMAATVSESRISWLLLALIALSGRLAAEQPDQLNFCFQPVARHFTASVVARPIPGAVT